MNIIRQGMTDSVVKGVILRLGAFHREMGFLGVIGHLMNNLGLKELLETVYTETSVSHMMTGKAYLSAVRGHLLVEIALRTIILSELYDFDLPKEKAEVSENCSTMDIDIEDSTKFV